MLQNSLPLCYWGFWAEKNPDNPNSSHIKISLSPVLFLLISQSRISPRSPFEFLKTKKKEKHQTKPVNATAINATPFFWKDKKEDPKNYSLDNLTIIPGKMMEQPILETVSRHTRDKNMIRISQHGFTEGKSCLMNLNSFDEMVL